MKNEYQELQFQFREKKEVARCQITRIRRMVDRIDRVFGLVIGHNRGSVRGSVQNIGYNAMNGHFINVHFTGQLSHTETTILQH